ncbi:TraR/DksA family transcriptional regulator [Streptomyces sp. H51]|uniref:TraR/DksA family transcriptional regulator n=1 Tax=Streptomyces sp. H51 TaxID=3111770 RepID=UPI002D79C35C|nr:TraR/DksA family transcriptional regulator [Streptomyces sp. H51]
MVAKKTAVQQPASGSSTRASGGAAEDVSGAKSGRAGATARTAKPAAGAAPAKRAVAGKDATKKPAKRSVTKATEKSVAKKAAEKGAAERSAAAEAATRKGAAGKHAGAGSATTTATADKSKADKSKADKSTAGKSTAETAGAAEAARQTGATTVVAKKTPGTATAATTGLPEARIATVEPGELAVRPGEDPWTPEEVEAARTELLSEDARLRAEISSSEAALVGLMRDSGDGAGDDQADTGTKNITREHELALAANAREMLIQTDRALERLEAGTYGLCENCGNPIGKARMQAFPRATLCVECKQKQERRY